MGVERADRAEMFSELKANFGRIYSHDAVTAEEVLTGVREVMGRNDRLSRYVS